MSGRPTFRAIYVKLQADQVDTNVAWLMERGRPDKALKQLEKWLSRALRLLENSPDGDGRTQEDHFLIMRIRSQIAAVMVKTGQHVEAEAIYTRLHQRYCATSGQLSAGALRMSSGIAAAHWALGHYEQAIEELQENVQLIDEHVGEDSIEAGDACRSLANCYTFQGRFQEAPNMFKRALTSYRRHLVTPDQRLIGLYNDFRVMAAQWPGRFGPVVDLDLEIARAVRVDEGSDGRPGNPLQSGPWLGIDSMFIGMRSAVKHEIPQLRMFKAKAWRSR